MMTPAEHKHYGELAGNLLKELTTPKAKPDVETLAREALDKAALHMQEALGVTDGGLAGQFFADGEIERRFIAYMKAEILFDSITKGQMA